jgi:hypothetical protein
LLCIFQTNKDFAGSKQQVSEETAQARWKAKFIYKEIHMTKIGRSIIAALVLGLLVAGMSGCTKKEGPMERAGKEIDKGSEKTGQKIDKAIGKTGEKIEEAGDKVKNTVK